MRNNIQNVYKIALKEFSDLIRSNIIIIVLAVYFILLIYSYYNTYNRANIALSQLGVVSTLNNPAISPGEITDVLCGYGGLVAVILGLSSMYNEVNNKAINTLIAKPIYRDTILNGKLLGATAFAICLFIFTILFDVSMNFLFWGEYFSKIFPTFLGEVPLVLLLFLLCFMIFYLLTVLMFLFFNKVGMSFFLAFIAWIFLYEVIPSGLGLCLASLFPNANQMSWIIVSLSPQEIVYLIYGGATDTIGAISSNLSGLLTLILYVTILLIGCYITFLRRDIE